MGVRSQTGARGSLRVADMSSVSNVFLYFVVGRCGLCLGTLLARLGYALTRNRIIPSAFGREGWWCCNGSSRGFGILLARLAPFLTRNRNIPTASGGVGAATGAQVVSG
jgi:hypothetical protein